MWFEFGATLVSLGFPFSICSAGTNFSRLCRHVFATRSRQLADQLSVTKLLSEDMRRADGLQPRSDGLHPASDGLQPTSHGLQPTSDGRQPTCDGLLAFVFWADRIERHSEQRTRGSGLSLCRLRFAASPIPVLTPKASGPRKSRSESRELPFAFA